MTLGSMAALFGALVVLALLPSVSVLAVTARSAASGFMHGAFTTMGVVVGDIIFILIAILGLSVLADAMGSLFVLVKYLGGAYVIWLGFQLWRARIQTTRTRDTDESSLLSSFTTGLLITLADQKAILFYLGFFPAFLHLPSLSWADTGMVVAIAVVAVGGAKLVYAFAADRVGGLVSPVLHRTINRCAGGLMIAVGLVVIAGGWQL